MKSVCVYCGSKTGAAPVYAHAARAVGQALAKAGLTLVYGGGRVGLMGVLADACLEAGGEVTGVIPDFLAQKEVAHTGVRGMRVVGSMHERKQIMADLSDAFIALPGGLGTMEELFEIWTWSQLGRHFNPVGLYNAAGYFDHLLAFLDHVTAEDFVEPRHRDQLVVSNDVEALLAGLKRAEHPGVLAALARDKT